MGMDGTDDTGMWRSQPTPIGPVVLVLRRPKNPLGQSGRRRHCPPGSCCVALFTVVDPVPSWVTLPDGCRPKKRSDAAPKLKMLVFGVSDIGSYGP
jgi:hypothetical protein